MVTTDNIVAAIELGSMSETDLDRIDKAVRYRRKRLAAVKLWELRPGQKCRVKNIGTGAKYLNGALVQVVNVGQSRVLVRILEVGSNGQYGTYRRQRFDVGTQVYLHAENLGPYEVIDGKAEKVNVLEIEDVTDRLATMKVVSND